MNVDVDVVVVGGGLSGLTAARDLVRAGRTVQVLEARDRVGGRTVSADLCGVAVDLGGTFVGPSQDRVLALAAELGCTTTPTRTEGDSLILWRGRLRRYHGTIPRIEAQALLDVERVRRLFGRHCRRVGRDRPWDSPVAARWDSVSLGGWLRSIRAGAGTRELFAILARTTWGCETDEVSMYHALRYVRGCGGLDRMLDTEGGAQQDHFPAGAHRLSERLAERLGDAVRLGCPVEGVAQEAGTATVRAGGTAVTCRGVVVAVPPALRGRIRFSPALPPPQLVLSQRWPQGELSKIYAAYETPFWRRAGLSGQSLADTGPVFVTFDTGPDRPDDAGPGVLLGFVGGAHARDWDVLAPDERRRDAVESLAAVFGPEAREPIGTVEQRWSAAEWSGGGPTAAPGTGAWTSSGRWLAEPAGVVHWAGTETADRWSGFMDGAVRAGERAAREVDAALGR